MSNKYYQEVYLDCPVCGAKKSFVIRQTLYNIPHQGPTILIGAKCSTCGYRFTWTLPYEQGKKILHELKVENQDDLNILLYIGENTDIEIPELGVEILSSDLDPGFITTVEGILLRVKEKAENLCKDKQDCINAVELLDDGIKGRKRFTLRLLDHYGRSYIMSEKVKKRLMK